MAGAPASELAHEALLNEEATAEGTGKGYRGHGQLPPPEVMHSTEFNVCLGGATHLSDPSDTHSKQED